MNANRPLLIIARNRAAILAFVLGLGLLGQSAPAQVVTWNNTGGTTDFNTATNWSGNILPGTSSIATFDAAASVQPKVSANISVSGLSFSTTTSGSYDLTSTNGASLTLLSTATGATGAINAANTSGINHVTAPLILGAGAGTTQTITLAGGSGGLQLDSVISSTNNVGLSLSSGANLNVFQANTYTGPTTISGSGTVVVSTIGNAGVNGNLGAGDTINLGLGSSSGSLVFGNSTSDTTNRTVNLNGTSVGGTISSIYSGALIFTSDFTATGTGSKTLTLGGIGAGANAIQGAIVDGNGITSVEKKFSGTWNLSGANSYTGSTSISGGLLTVSSLADGGTNSNLGASSNAAGNLVLSFGGTLRYTGAAASTDRLFTVGPISGTIDASGTGALNFTNSGSMAFSGGSRTLTLTGSNTGANILAATIADVGGVTTIAKSGAGTWVLSGANTYTGATTVNAGSLLLTGSLGNSTISVNNGGTFGGTGTATGGLTLNSGGHVAPGNGLGLLTVGAFTWNGGGALNFDLGTGNASDQLAITGALAKSGSGFSFDFLSGGTAGNTYTLLTFGSITGGFVAGDLSFANLGSGLTGAFTFNANSLDFSVSAIPEPATSAAILGAVALTGAACLRRRQRKAT